MSKSSSLEQKFSEENIKKIFSKVGENESEIIENNIRFLQLSMDKDIVKFDPDDKVLPLLLWSLTFIDNNSLTSRVLNAYRDIFELRLKKESINSIENYAYSYGINAIYQSDYSLYSLNPEIFATYSRRVTGSKFRLVNQTFLSGEILIENDVLRKIIREAFVVRAKSILEKIDAEKCHIIMEPISEELLQIQETARQMKYSGDLGSVDVSCFPPCILHFLSDAKSGINLAHMARFTMVSFLHNAGMKNEEIMEIFKSAPDFNERITTYQVNHVTGASSGTSYSPPRCTVLKSNHLCYMDSDYVCNTDWLKHPLQYYSYKKKKKNFRKVFSQ
ncbi:DNA primase large subunit [mine drainage metagenome]|uniref:DNA primase large subunit n=1 Tax=mine drainage metagenome TaxID=410659 RepID=T1BXV7_9ZZZZ